MTARSSSKSSKIRF